MEHSKAEFRATRERVGLTQAALAKALGVEVRSVKRWESPSAPQRAPQDAWDVLGELMELQDAALDAAEHAARESPDGVIPLHYWAGQDDHDHDARAGGHGDWRTANATARAVAITLEALGYAVEWRDA